MSTKMILVMLLPLWGLKPQTNGNLGVMHRELQFAVAGAVAKKKQERGSSSSHLKPATITQKVTSFIAQTQSRQEFPHLLGKAID